MLKYKHMRDLIYNPIEAKMPKIIEYFVRFYGEKNRAVITERLNKAVFVYINRHKEKIYDLIKTYFDFRLQYLARSILREFKPKNLEYNTSLLLKNIKNMDKLKPCAENLELVKEKDILTLLSCFDLRNIDLKKLSPQRQEDLKNIIIAIVDMWEEKKGEYNRIIDEFNEFIPPEYYNASEETIAQSFEQDFTIENYRKIVNDDFLFGKTLLNATLEFSNSNEENRAFTMLTARRKDPLNALSICVLPCGLFLPDSVAIHELNHIVESDLISISKGKFWCKTGFSITKVDLKTEETKCSSYIFFDEAINDYLSFCIYLKMKEEGFKIGALDYETSVYSIAFPLLDGFIMENFDLLTDCRINKTYQNFAEHIGKENYMRLAQITHLLIEKHYEENFYDCIEEIKSLTNLTDIYAFLDSKEREKASPYTQEFLKYFEEARKVFADIKTYQETQKEREDL